MNELSSRFAMAVVLAGVLALPAPPDEPTKEQRQASAKNLRQIAIAFHDAHDALGFLPGDTVSKDGKALLSWRVAILPYLGEEKLHKEFKLNEPWDSAHNKKLIDKMPKVYAPVRGRAEPGLTYYQSFYGPKTLFDPKAKTRPTMAFVSENNGTSNTILAIEAGVPTVWTKPLDLPFDPKKALPARGGLFGGDFHVLFCDGSVRLLYKATSEKPLKCAIQPENAEPFNFDKP